MCCATVCWAASRCAVLCCAVVFDGPIVLPARRGMASALVRLVALLCFVVGSGYMAGWWPLGLVWRGAARWVSVAGVWVSRSVWWVRRVSLGCPPLGHVPWSRVLWGSLSLGVRGFPCSGLARSPRLSSVPSHPIPLPPCRPPSLVSRPCAHPPRVSVRLRLCGGPCSGRWPGSLSGGLGCGGGLCGALGGFLCGCSPLFLCGCTFLCPCGDRWSVGATRCGSCGVGSGLRWRVLSGVRLWDGPLCTSVRLCPLGISRC